MPTKQPRQESQQALLSRVTKEMDEPRMATSSRQDLDPAMDKTPVGTIDPSRSPGPAPGSDRVAEPTENKARNPVTPEHYRLLQKTHHYYVDAINDHAAWKLRERDKRTKPQLQKRLDEIDKQLHSAIPSDHPASA